LRKVVVLTGILLLLALLQGCGEKESQGQAQIHEITQEELGKKIDCPICGMKLMVSSQTLAADYKGQTYYFCNEEERAQFMRDPGKYPLERKKQMQQRQPEEKEKAPEKTEKEPEITEDEVKASGYGFHKVSQEEIDQIHLCPGCDKYLAVGPETPALEKDGEVFYFCSKSCMRAFLDRKK